QGDLWLPLRVVPVSLEGRRELGKRRKGNSARVQQSSVSVLQCREVGKQNQSERCSFIQSNPDCKMDGGFLSYLNGVFCVFPATLQPLAITLYVRTKVAGPKLFCPNLSAISTKLKLSHNVAVSFILPHGVTFLAFGNGAPDVFSAVVAFSDPRTAGLAIGALFGYLGLYIFYVLTVVVSTWLHKRQRQERLAPPSPGEPELPTDSDDGDASSTGRGDYGEEYQLLLPSQESTLQILTHSMNPLDYRKWRRKSCHWRMLKACKLPVEVVLLLTVPIVDPDREDQNWKRPLNCLHLITGPLVCILTLKSGAYGFFKIQGVFPIWGLVTLVGAAVATIVFCTTRNEEPPRYHCVFAFLGFLVSALWINAAATEVVNILRTLGVIFRLSNTVLGLTLLAWGNSIGDTFSDLTMARQGYPRMAFSACFGGIIFNMLVGVGLGCLLQMTNSKLVVRLESDGLLVWILAGALGLSLVFSFLSVPAQCFRLGPAYGCCLIAYYVVFLTIALLTEFRVIRVSSV
uniref:Solute carrier family 8 member B1 n=1 Tax=Varanus komodoensis TaxID=61221 RepID=A0A8D2J092_VARKO